MSTERLIFEHVLDGMFNKSLKGRITPELKKELARAGVDLDRKLLPAYPLATWAKACELAVRTLYPGASMSDGFRQLGEETVEGVTRTLIGKAMASTAKLIGPARILKRAEKILRSATNFHEVKLTEISPNHFQLWLNETAPGEDYYVGQFLAVLRFSGAAEPRATVVERQGAAATFDLTWST